MNQQFICRNCQNEVLVYAGQAVVNNKLVWNLAYSCADCGFQYEEDGNGLPPENIRKRILKNTEKWTLCIHENVSKVTVIKVLREALELDLNKTKQLLKQIPGCLMTGTKAEVEWLSKLLEKQGINVNKIRE